MLNSFACVCSSSLSLLLRTRSYAQPDMENFESGEDALRCVLWFKPMSWLGQIRPHRRDEAWSASLWKTFFASCVGANIPALSVGEVTLTLVLMDTYITRMMSMGH